MTLVLFLLSLYTEPVSLTPDEGAVLAVITHKGGVAKGLAHNHFIYAGEYQLNLKASKGKLDDLVFNLSLPVEKLVVDEHGTSSKWYSRLEELDILDEAFEELSQKNRDKIRKAMLGKKQLNAKKHANIKASLTRVEAKASTVGGVSYSHALHVTVTILGVPKKTELAANLEWKDGALRMEAVGELKFSDFEMDPYSAMLGAVSNQDQFHIFVNLSAR